MTTQLDLRTLGITVSTEDGEPIAVTFFLPDGSEVVEPFPLSGPLTVRLALDVTLALDDEEPDPPPPPAGEHPLDGIAGLTGAWSLSRNLLSTFSGSRYTLVSGAISALADQSGNGRHLSQSTASFRPVVEAINGVDAASFDGTDDRLQTIAPVLMSTLITAGEGYIIASGVIDACSTNDDTVFHNPGFFNDSGNFLGVYPRNGGGSPSLRGYNWDTESDETAPHAFTFGDPIVVEWRHEDGQLYSRVNKGAWHQVPSGNTGNGTLTGTFVLGAEISGGVTTFLDCRIAEVATFNVVPDASVMDGLVDNLLAHLT